MPDAWEAANGFDPNDPADGSATGADGYSNLETFLNGVDDVEPELPPPPPPSPPPVPRVFTFNFSFEVEDDSNLLFDDLSFEVEEV